VSREPHRAFGLPGGAAGATAVGNGLPASVVQALSQSWSEDTSADPENWSEETPALGQCAVTALIVQELLGGDLLRGEVRGTSHYWNLLPSGGELDLTRYQFGSHVQPGSVETRSRDYVLAFPDTRARYGRLRGKVMARLRAAGERLWGPESTEQRGYAILASRD
jgi:hypothetical protein